MNPTDGGPPPAAAKRRFFDRGSTSPTVIGAGSVVTGNLRGAGPFLIAGEVHGDGDLGGALSIETTGLWKGEVRARQAIVAGKLEGGLHVEEKLEIGRTAVIRGTVSARSVAIAKGAVVDGKIEITSGTPLVHFEEKRGGKE